MKRPLDGINVVDFSWVGAGSYATKILADLGANVIKIESSQKIDGIRLSPPFANGESGVNRSGYFSDRNTSKRSMLLNLKAPGAVDLALKLIETADIVCNNFSPGVMERLGLSYETVSAVNPRIVYLSMSMNGDSGPERSARGYGAMMSAVTGFHHLTGIPGLPPTGTGTNFPDHIPNPGHATFAMLVALRHSKQTGQGQQIDMSQTEAMLVTLGPEFLDWTVNDHDREPLGNREDGLYWQGVLPAAGDDAWISISARTEDDWSSLLTLLRLPLDLTPQDHLDQVTAAVARITNHELAAQLQGVHVPAAPVLTPPEVIQDPQLVYRDHWKTLDHAEMGETLYNGQPFTFSHSTVQPSSSAPLLGEHTEQICTEVLGLTADEIVHLRQSGVLV